MGTTTENYLASLGHTAHAVTMHVGNGEFAEASVINIWTLLSEFSYSKATKAAKEIQAVLGPDGIVYAHNGQLGFPTSISIFREALETATPADELAVINQIVALDTEARRNIATTNELDTAVTALTGTDTKFSYKPIQDVREAYIEPKVTKAPWLNLDWLIGSEPRRIMQGENLAKKLVRTFAQVGGVLVDANRNNQGSVLSIHIIVNSSATEQAIQAARPAVSSALPEGNTFGNGSK